jgi:S1-C subfamily serine protease
MELDQVYARVSRSIVAFVQGPPVERPLDAPSLPDAFATGFFLDNEGWVATNRHVIEAFENAPKRSDGRPSVQAMLFDYGERKDGRIYARSIGVRILQGGVLSEWDPPGPWFGEPAPDVGFVQLNVREVEPLDLEQQDGYLKVGMPIATAGYPLGSVGLRIWGRPNQMVPFLRRGIVSSVFPFSVPQPHGFTIDVMQQGGSSGSPIFHAGEPLVVGMMSSSLTERITIQNQHGSLLLQQNTNISYAIPSAFLASVFAQFRRETPSITGNVPTYEQLIANPAGAGAVYWEQG